MPLHSKKFGGLDIVFQLFYACAANWERLSQCPNKFTSICILTNTYFIIYMWYRLYVASISHIQAGVLVYKSYVHMGAER